ncbi:unnamed protein product [Aspergillus oryzae]|uniref:Unnamed protein product n=1 Tax=Aspergillus oryzae var. brunneus TaxID=332754 RepID=A0ABQ6KDD1_ASPOZ|nr:unnamed protein product [Aspergillus oryzae]GMF84138.1 unnamed protein product [Aspergillus oryzae]GMG01632.1 unnamed protein product [Aspergillus oryzae]GMG42402.1 unnamed protein product [Aspergillus oryzae var. brunneus]
MDGITNNNHGPNRGKFIHKCFRSNIAINLSGQECFRRDEPLLQPGIIVRVYPMQQHARTKADAQHQGPFYWVANPRWLLVGDGLRVEWNVEAPDQQIRIHEWTGTAEGSMESPPVIVNLLMVELSCGWSAKGKTTIGTPCGPRSINPKPRAATTGIIGPPAEFSRFSCLPSRIWAIEIPNLGQLHGTFFPDIKKLQFRVLATNWPSNSISTSQWGRIGHII